MCLFFATSGVILVARVRRDREWKQGEFSMIERLVERRALPRKVIDLPALLSFDGISGVHPCIVHDFNAIGACLSTPYYLFASDSISRSTVLAVHLHAGWCGGRLSFRAWCFVPRRRVNARRELANIAQRTLQPK